MNKEYDAIILGSGFKENLLAALLQKFYTIGPEKKNPQLLLINVNKEHGSSSGTISLEKLYKMKEKKVPEELGPERDWSIDKIPKFVIANGTQVKMLIKLGVVEGIEYCCVEQTFVCQYIKPLLGKNRLEIYKVPVSAGEALKSDLMGMFEKNKCRKFLSFVTDFNIKDQKTYHPKVQPDEPFSKLVENFGLEVNTIDFIGHSVALYTNDSFLNRPSKEVIDKIQLYYNSFGIYGDSSFLYPVYGLSTIPYMFTRICGARGAVQMRRTVEEILYDENGNFSGIKSEGEVAKAKILIADPSVMVPFNKVKSIGRVIRCICFMKHSIKGHECSSAQIIMPQRQINRKNDIFIVFIGDKQKVCPKGYYIAIISTILETNGNPHDELKSAFEILGDVEEYFDIISDLYEPIDKEYKGNIYIPSSLDQLSHFEEDTIDVVRIYEKLTGEKIDLETKKQK